MGEETIVVSLDLLDEIEDLEARIEEVREAIERGPRSAVPRLRRELASLLAELDSVTAEERREHRRAG